MGIMVNTLLWVMQDLYHQPYGVYGFRAPGSEIRVRFRVRCKGAVLCWRPKRKRGPKRDDNLENYPQG